MRERDHSRLSLDGDEVSDGHAFVFLPMISGERPYHAERSISAEYRDRRPACVPVIDRSSALIQIHNVGNVASDIVILDYRVVLCSLSAHGPADGFLGPHTGEVDPQPVDLYATADVVRPGDFITKKIEWTAFDWLKNVYLRARVTTLWEETVPPHLWDPLEDPRVTEAYLHIA